MWECVIRLIRKRLLWFFDLDDLPMLVAPSEAAALLEIGVAHAEGIDFIVHAMPARSRFLD